MRQIVFHFSKIIAYLILVLYQYDFHFFPVPGYCWKVHEDFQPDLPYVFAGTLERVSTISGAYASGFP